MKRTRAALLAALVAAGALAASPEDRDGGTAADRESHAGAQNGRQRADRDGGSPDAGTPDPDEDVINHLDVLQNLELLQNLDLFDTAAPKKK